MNTTSESSCEVAIVGGSFAGVQAALMLARARKRVLLFDDAQPRNRFASHSHSVLGHDGKPPAQLMGEAREQLLRYPTVALRTARVVTADAQAGGFVLGCDDETRVTARKLVLATGIRDLLPPLPGLAERWGATVLHCPYCHGYEVADRPLGVLGNAVASPHQALLISEWGPTTYFSQGVHLPDAEQTAALERRGVTIEHVPVVALEGEGSALRSARLADGREVALAGMFTAPHSEPASDLYRQLGCDTEPGPLGPFVRVDALQRTSVPGVFAAGDLATAMQSAPLAIAAGTLAGVAAHRSLLEEA